VSVANELQGMISFSSPWLIYKFEFSFNFSGGKSFKRDAGKILVIKARIILNMNTKI